MNFDLIHLNKKAYKVCFELFVFPAFKITSLFKLVMTLKFYKDKRGRDLFGCSCYLKDYLKD